MQEESGQIEWKLRVRKAYDMLDDAYRTQLDATNGKEYFQKRIIDLFYIPQRFVEAFAFDLLPTYREARVHSEAAIPNILYAIDHPANWDHVLDDMVYRWDLYDSRESHRKNYRPESFWSSNISALHPWKVSHDDERKMLLHSLNQVDSCVCQDFADFC